MRHTKRCRRARRPGRSWAPAGARGIGATIALLVAAIAWLPVAAGAQRIDEARTAAAHAVDIGHRSPAAAYGAQGAHGAHGAHGVRRSTANASPGSAALVDARSPDATRWRAVAIGASVGAIAGAALGAAFAQGQCERPRCDAWKGGLAGGAAIGAVTGAVVGVVIHAASRPGALRRAVRWP